MAPKSRITYEHEGFNFGEKNFAIRNTLKISINFSTFTIEFYYLKINILKISIDFVIQFAFY